MAGAVSRFAHVLYLSEGGDDEDGTGSQADPYRTVNKAIEVINASSETDWAVVMGPGLYTYTTANALPVLGGTKRVAWVGSGAELTTLHISQPQDGDAEEAFPWDSPTLSYAAIDGVSITSEIYVVLEDECGYSWILDFATLQSAASEDACISSSALVVESGSPNMRIHTDGDVVGSYLSKTDLFAADGMGLARSMRGCRVFLGVVNAIDVVNCQAAGAGGSINGTRVFGCSSGRNINGTESVISCTLNSEVVDSRITSPLVDGCTVNGGRLFQSLDASNTWRVRNTKLVRSTGGNRDIVDFLGGTGLKTTVMEDVHFVYTGTFEEEPSGDVTVLAIHDGRHDVTLINCTIDSTCIPIMRSHPNVLIDGNRLSAKNIRMIGGSLTLRRAADDGPEDRNSCVVDSGLGEMVFEGVTFRNLTEASTREDVAYACVSCRSDTGGADGTSTILFNNCTFESTLPAADIAGAKCSVLFLSDIGAETVYVTFEGVTTIREDGNQDHTFGGVTYSKGSLVTPQMASTIKTADPSASLLVRSTMRCEHGTGVCQQCAGLAPNGQMYSMGTNVGVLATQALGERATQLTLKAFHSGGVATQGTDMVGGFARVRQLTSLPSEIPNAARLATKGGVVEKIEKTPTGSSVWVGGVKHFVPNDPYGNPLFMPRPGTTSSTGPGGTSWSGIKVGQTIAVGQTLTDPSRTSINPRDLYRATANMSTVQNQLVTELHDVYGAEGVRRQHTEAVVRSLSDVTRVVASGSSDSYLKGQFTSRSQLQAKNKQLLAAGLQPVEHIPVLKGIETMPLEVQEDWMAKLNHRGIRGSLMDSAAIGATSNLHGVNPVPGMAYGAEFGMNQTHSFEAPHLKDVKPYSY